MRRLLISVAAAFLGSVGWNATVLAQTTGGTGDEPAVQPDNTAVNKRDTQRNEPTADQQSNSMSDVKLTAKIRRAVMKNKSLSTNGHNVKIIVAHGKVTLKGPVASDAEKTAIEQAATKIASSENVTSELSVKP